MSLKGTGKGIPMKNSYVADTMAVVLRLEKRKMPMMMRNIFSKAVFRFLGYHVT
jgi:hypothetical protein